MDIEVKRNVPTVTVSWEKKDAEGEDDKTERTGAGQGCFHGDAVSS